MESIHKLEMHGMSRVFGATTALYDFNLEVSGGMFVTLLGPSGCGKSTALNCLAGLLELSAGEIVLNGKPIQDVPAEKRGFGMVFQNYALFPHLNVTRNVSYGLEMRPMPKSERDRRVHWALDLVHLDEETFGRRFPAQLSGGQQQRLAIARTVVLEPNLLLLDEPLSNLDAKLRTEMRIEIKRLHKELRLTTIYVTHDQGEAMSLSDLVVVMRQGRIEQIGTPQEIYTCPRSLYVADFMGYSNKLAAQIVGRDGENWLIQTDGGTPLQAISTFEGSAAWKNGDRVLACCRPDEVLADPTQGPNRMRGIAQLVDYVGKAFEVLVRLAVDETTQLLIHSETSRDPETDIEFGIRPNRLLLFPYENVAALASTRSRLSQPVTN